MTPVRSMLLALACLAAGAGVAQQTAPQAPAPAAETEVPDEEDLPEVREELDFTLGRGLEDADRQKLDILVPPGQSHEEVRYPIYRSKKDEPGPPLASVFQTRRVTRLDDWYLFIEDALFLSFDNLKNPETPTRRVTFEKATYDLQHDLLYTDEPVKVEDPQLNILTGGMIYDRITGMAVFSNGVELFPRKKPQPKPAPSAASAASGDHPASPPGTVSPSPAPPAPSPAPAPASSSPSSP